MKSLLILFSFFALYSFQLSNDEWSEKLKLKIETEVKRTYEVEEYQLKEVAIKKGEESKTKSKMTKHFYAVSSSDTEQGYIYVAQAPSMKNVFDYIVLFDSNFEIISTKVLIYREQHGRQIGTKRWLSQFFGMTPNDRPELGKQVDGITGATISAKSMTIAVHDLLESIDYLKSQDFLND